MKCPHCKSPRITRKGRRRTKFGSRQLLYCKDCKKEFTDSKLLYKTYGPKVISNAISYYNLGNTLEKTAKLVNVRFKVKTSKSSVSQWLKEFKNICTYCKLRPKAVRMYPKDILASKTFVHNGLAYNFKFHKAKLEMLCQNKDIAPIATYIKRLLKDGCPSFFDKIENRCSQMKVEVKISKDTKLNNACQLVDFALRSCSKSTERHSTVENFMLINDSATIAVEVPVWFWEKSMDLGISGHIDVLQVRNNKIYILDFKPKAAKESEQKVASQLFWYAKGLSFRTTIPLKMFVCAWFDENSYHEFIPSKIDIKHLR